MMTSYDLTNRPGKWRAGSIYVRNDETGEVVREGPDIHEVPSLINELVDYLNFDSAASSIIKAGMAHLNLVMIHPFPMAMAACRDACKAWCWPGMGSHGRSKII